MPISIPIIVAVVVVLAAIVFAISRYKVARVDQALIITGGGEPKIYRSKGGIVWPIIRKHSFFDLCLRTISSKGDLIKTITGVPIFVDWTAQIRPNSEDPEALKIAATSFLERKPDEIRADIKYTLDGAVREVVASMTPEEVMRDKERFADNVKSSVKKEMEALGYLLVSLNIQDVDDKQGYYVNLAAKDREERRREAETITADADKVIREKKALADQTATEAELNARVAVASRTRDTEIKEAEFKAETDKHKADAEIAGQLRMAERQRELATNEGQINVEKQTQADLVAKKRQEVARTEAETAKIEVTINAEAEAAQAKIAAEATAKVKQTEAAGIAEAEKTAAEGKAEAVRRQASGEADSVKAKAEAEAQRITQTGQAEADATKARGLAEAEASKAKGLAEAEAIKAKGLAEAEAENALAAARAANDKVNFEIAKLEIERDTKVQIATQVATVVASVGEKASFIDLGGSKGPEGDILTRVLSNVPSLMKKLGVENMALNGEPFENTLRGIVSAAVEPLGVLNKEKSNTVIGEGIVPQIPSSLDDPSIPNE